MKKVEIPLPDPKLRFTIDENTPIKRIKDFVMAKNWLSKVLLFGGKAAITINLVNDLLQLIDYIKGANKDKDSTTLIQKAIKNFEKEHQNDILTIKKKLG